MITDFFQKTIKSLVLFFTFGLILSFAPEDKLYKIIDTFNAYHKFLPFEKVYIHTDKNYYTTGENIWFKGYLTDGMNRPDTLSRVVYAELINRDKEIISELMLKVENSTFKGDFQLNDSLSPGTYQIRAYTNYMRNWGNDFFFKKNIPVLSVGYKKYNWNITPVQSDTLNSDQFLYKIELADRNNLPQKNVGVEYKIRAKRLKSIKGSHQTDEEGRFFVTLANPTDKQERECSIELSIPGLNEKWVYNLSLQKEQPVVEFFPEGGNLVREIENRVAFKITTSNGKGIDAVVQVFNQDSSEVANVKSNHLGFGVFNLFPLEGEKYYSKVTFNNVVYGDYSLPEILERGYSLFVDNLDKNEIYIKAARNFEKENQDYWSIICQTKGKAILKIQGIPENGEMNVTIPKKDLPDGVYHVTLFDQDDVPQCERLVFIDSGKRSELKLSTIEQDDETYKFELKLQDSTMKSANISVSVLNMDIAEDLLPFQGNIFSFFELTSELRGTVESPGYYFKDDSLHRKIDMDYLLMTQGWRKFVWKEMLDGKMPDFNYSIEPAIKISGKISNYSKRGKENEEVTLMLFKGENTQFYQCRSDSAGRFTFYANFNDTLKVLIQTKKKKNNVERRLTLDKRTSPFIDDFASYLSDISANESLNRIKKSAEVRELVEELYEFGTDRKIDEVTVSAKKLERGPKIKPQKVLMVEDLEEEIANRRNYEYSSIFHFIADNYSGTSIRPGIQIPGRHVDDPPKYYPAPGGKNFLFVGGEIALVFLNDEPIFSFQEYFNVLQNVSWRSVEKVMIYESGACQFTFNADCKTPAIFIYTNRDGMERVRHIGIRRFDVSGYYRAREFYQPVLSGDVRANIPEYRTTVYWNPKLICDSTGIFSFQIAKKYLPANLELNVEGLTDTGKPVVARFNISKPEK